ncbi:CBS domain-containing protein [Pendulispora brunnea]|uniref:CBS domain-containing protein n=1 Tax=Pendulispora brunnea TaxID=2905690 RepID=A0ABZ2JYZ7_9BACT
MSLSRFLRAVTTVSETDPVAVAAGKLRDAHVGCVVVTRGGRPVGIVTDRDLAVRVVAEGRDPWRTLVSDIVTYDPIVLEASDGIETAVARMREHGVRRLPIVDASGAVVGIVTSDDLVLLVGREMSDLCEGINGSADTCDSR